MDSKQPAWLRYTKRLGFWAFVGAYLFIFWLSFGAGIWGFLSPFIQGMIN